jgi:hypothetical protein
VEKINLLKFLAIIIINVCETPKSEQIGCGWAKPVLTFEFFESYYKLISMLRLSHKTKYILCNLIRRCDKSLFLIKLQKGIQIENVERRKLTFYNNPTVKTICGNVFTSQFCNFGVYYFIKFPS